MKPSFFTSICLLLLFIPTPSISLAQIQLGQDIHGDPQTAYFTRAGYSVALSSDGRRLAVGAPFLSNTARGAGNVRVYELIHGSWQQMGSDINGEDVHDRLGLSVSLSGDGNILAIGIPMHEGAGTDVGQVKVFQYLGNNWAQLGQNLDGFVDQGRFGHSISLSENGSLLAIGAPFGQSSGLTSGMAHVYRLDSGNWVPYGAPVAGKADLDRFGISVSLAGSGKRLAVGAQTADGGGIDAGSVQVYKLANNRWVHMGDAMEGNAPGDLFGTSVALSFNGDRVVAGAHFNDTNGDKSGQVKVYEWSNGSWLQLGSSLHGVRSGLLGFSVAIDDNGGRIVIGSPQNGVVSPNPGYLAVFDFVGGDWMQMGDSLYGGNSYEGYGFSSAISADGQFLAIGAPYFSGAGTETGLVQVFELTHPTQISPLPADIKWTYTPAQHRLFVYTPGFEIQGMKLFDMNGRDLPTHTQLNPSDAYLMTAYTGLAIVQLSLKGRTIYRKFFFH